MQQRKVPKKVSGAAEVEDVDVVEEVVVVETEEAEAVEVARTKILKVSRP